MSGFITMNRYKIKRYLSQLFDLAARNQRLEKRLEMYDIIDLLESELYKFCILMRFDFERFEKALVDIRWHLGRYRGRPDWRLI